MSSARGDDSSLHREAWGTRVVGDSFARRPRAHTNNTFTMQKTSQHAPNLQAARRTKDFRHSYSSHGPSDPNASNIKNASQFTWPPSEDITDKMRSRAPKKVAEQTNEGMQRLLRPRPSGTLGYSDSQNRSNLLITSPTEAKLSNLLLRSNPFMGAYGDNVKKAPALEPPRPLPIIMDDGYDIYNPSVLAQVTEECEKGMYMNTPGAIATYHQLAMADDLYYGGIWKELFMVNQSSIIEYHNAGPSRPEVPDRQRRDRRQLFVWAQDSYGKTGWCRVIKKNRLVPAVEMKATPTTELHGVLDLWKYFFARVPCDPNLQRYAELVAPRYVDRSYNAENANVAILGMFPGSKKSTAALRVATKEEALDPEAAMMPQFIPTVDAVRSAMDVDTPSAVLDSSDPAIASEDMEMRPAENAPLDVDLIDPAITSGDAPVAGNMAASTLDGSVDLSAPYSAGVDDGNYSFLDDLMGFEQGTSAMTTSEPKMESACSADNPPDARNLSNAGNVLTRGICSLDDPFIDNPSAAHSTFSNNDKFLGNNKLANGACLLDDPFIDKPSAANNTSSSNTKFSDNNKLASSSFSFDDTFIENLFATNTTSSSNTEFTGSNDFTSNEFAGYNEFANGGTSFDNAEFTNKTCSSDMFNTNATSSGNAFSSDMLAANATSSINNGFTSNNEFANDGMTLDNAAFTNRSFSSDMFAITDNASGSNGDFSSSINEFASNNEFADNGGMALDDNAVLDTSNLFSSDMFATDTSSGSNNDFTRNNELAGDNDQINKEEDKGQEEDTPMAEWMHSDKLTALKSRSLHYL